MAQPFHTKGEARRRAQLRQQNASAIKLGGPALIIAGEKREEGKRGARVS